MSNPTLTKNFTAEAAITKRRIVKLGTADGQVVPAAAATDALIGIAAELDAAITTRVDVHVAGIAEVELGGTVTRGQLVTADASGRAVAATRHTHTENTAGTYTQSATTGVGSGERAIGFALVSGVVGDIGTVLIAPAFV